MKEPAIFISIALTTLFGVEIIRQWGLRRRLLDVPNERSSHTKPTPKGGGLIIVAVCLSVYTLTTVFLNGHFQWSYLTGAILIAVISWLDDLFTVSFIWRFVVHSLAALLIVSTLGYFDELYFPVVENLNIGWSGAFLTFFWIVWLTNAYNFMDGIDGLAGIQAVTAGFGWLLVGKFFGADSTAFYGGVLMFSGIGFLIKNWQPAKIFMGDVGSAFLGFTFAVMPLLMKNETGQNYDKRTFLFSTAVILVWLFAFDTLWTFARRVLEREKVWEAHRRHLYQRIVIRGFSHAYVSILYGTLSIFNVLAVLISLENNYWQNLPVIFVMIQSIGLLIWFRFLKDKSGSQ